MASNTKSGEIHLPDYVINLVNEAAVKEGFSDYTITPTAGAKHGDGFQSLMISIDVTGKQTKNGIPKENSTLAMICKMPPLSEIRRKEFDSNKVFEREVCAYEEILPIFSEFQREKGLSNEEGFYNYPKCYGTYSNAEKGDYAILMDDLRQQEYIMFNKFETLTFVHAKLVMKTLAKLHAISFALKNQRPDVFNKFENVKADGFRKMLDKPASVAFWKNSFSKAISALDDNETELINKMNKLRDNFAKEVLSCISMEANDPLGVICHGDCWNNNFLFLYDKIDPQPHGVSLIDWQCL